MSQLQIIYISYRIMKWEIFVIILQLTNERCMEFRNSKINVQELKCKRLMIIFFTCT